jgi:hypothetical protein
MPARQCSRVDLPEPLGPITATISPSSRTMLAPRSAWVGPNDLCRSSPTRIWDIAHLLSQGRQAGLRVVDPPQIGLEVEQLEVGDQPLPLLVIVDQCLNVSLQELSCDRVSFQMH